MARVIAFHNSENPGVYHICTRCTEGKNIETRFKKPGTGGGSLCKACQDRIRKGTC